MHAAAHDRAAGPRCTTARDRGRAADTIARSIASSRSSSSSFQHKTTMIYDVTSRLFASFLAASGQSGAGKVM